MNRFDGILEGANQRSPDTNMRLLIQTVTPSVIVPEVSKYYVFVYKAKTRNIRYDRNPFVVCSGVYKWGFSGFNFHWGMQRNYSWNEVVTNLYEIKEDEVPIIRDYPIAHFKGT